MGKPNMTIIAAFCLAFEAIAAKKVKTILKLRLPKNTKLMNRAVLITGYVIKKEKTKKLKKLINSINTLLKRSLDKIKYCGAEIT